MERVEYNRNLPDEMVEKIISMVPFPSIFKARCLSKSWRARFSAIGSLDDKGEKCLATLFQKQVRDRSKNWGPFGPVSISKEFSCAFDWGSQNWVRLPSVSFLPKEGLDAMSNLCLNGALLWSLDVKARILYVANIFTQSWRALPPPSNLKDILFCNPVLVSDTSETYKLILFYEDAALEELEQWSALMYDSKSGAWSSNNLVEQVPLLGNPAYVNGVLYMVASYDLRNLLALNLEEGTSEELKLVFHEHIEIESVNLVFCDAKLLIIVSDVDSPETVRVLQIDLESLQLLELTRAPAALKPCSSHTYQPISHGDCIIFGMRRSDDAKSALVYNVHKNEWTSVNSSVPGPKMDNGFGSVSFQPGLNPFLAV